jgi:hypothetical protein
VLDEGGCAMCSINGDVAGLLGMGMRKWSLLSRFLLRREGGKSGRVSELMNDGWEG